MPGGAINITIGGNAQQLTQAAGQAANALNGFAGAANAAGTAADHAFDEIAAGAAAMARIEAAIEAAAAAARNAGTALQLIGSNAITSITPLNTLEARLNDIRDAIGRSATVQGAANLGAQYEVINRNLAETRTRIESATQAAVGLSRAFNAVSTSSAGLNRLSPAIRPALTDLRLMPPAANAAAASLTRLRGAGGQANATLTDFSRIVQDSPYGIIGIGNNITQLADSFGNLVRSSGGAGAAFRALFSSATGFGGIGLIISAITTAVTFASVGFSAWTRGLSGSKKAADEAAEAAKKFLDSLKSVNDVTGEATGGVQGQIAQVQALSEVVKDTNSSYNQRAAALRELKQINKSYFGDLKLEESQMSTLTSRVNEYTKALVQQAIVKGFTDEISKVAVELAKQEKALQVAKDAFGRYRSDLDKTSKTETSLTGEDRISQRYINIKNATDKAKAAFESQRDVVEKLRGNLVGFNSVIGEAVKKQLEFRDLSKPEKESGANKQDAVLKALRKELAGYEKQLKDINELRAKGVLPINEENDALALQLKIFETLSKIDAREVAIKAKSELDINPRILDLQIAEAIRLAGVRASAGARAIKIPFLTRFVFSDKSSPNLFSPADLLGPDAIPANAFDGVTKGIQENAAIRLAELRKNLGESLRETLRLGIIEGLQGAGDALGTAIAGIFNGESVGRSLAAAGEGILKIVGGVLQDMGKQIILASALVQKLKTALASLFTNPAASLAVGIGLVALGSLLKSIKLSGGVTPGFADGVTNFTGGQALVGERGPELVTLPAGSNVIPRDPFSVQVPAPSLFARGDDLYLSYNRTASRRRRI